MRENFLCSLLLTLRAQAVKIQSMVDHFKSRLLGNFCRHNVQALEVRIDDLFTPGTDNMGMGERFVSVVAVAPLTEFQFKNLSKLLKQSDRLVNRSKAGRRKILDDNLVDFLYAGVVFAAGQNSQDRQTLRRDPLTPLFQL